MTQQDSDYASTQPGATAGDVALKANSASPAFTGNPTAPTPANGDNDTSIATSAFVRGEGMGALRYRALLTFADGANPTVAAVLENTLGGTVVWTRNGEGEYWGTLASAFLANKCLFFVSNALLSNPLANGQVLSFCRGNDNIALLSAFEIGAGAASDIITSGNGTVSIEIIKYP